MKVHSPGATGLRNIYPAILGIALLFLSQGTSFAQGPRLRPIKNPKVVISGTVQETTDFFDRRRFIGKVINKEKRRIDFIKIEFTLRDREGKVLEFKSVYIKGQRHIFRDRNISTSSLNPGKTGTFEVTTSTPADRIFSYSYKIIGINFIYP